MVSEVMDEIVNMQTTWNNQAQVPASPHARAYIAEEQPRPIQQTAIQQDGDYTAPRTERTDLPSVTASLVFQSNVSQPVGHGPVPGPGINYTGPREVLLEFVSLVF